MSNGQIILNRQQLGKFLSSQDAIRAFEQLFKIASKTTPDQLQDLQITAENAHNNAVAALSYLAQVMHELSLLLTAPVHERESMNVSDYVPPTEPPSGMALQNPDNVSISGGNVRALLTNTSATELIKTTATLANGAGAFTGTLTNAPVAGNPTKWLKVNDNGVARYIPCW